MPKAFNDTVTAAPCLERVAPGYYIDSRGREYFYLTGLYPLLTKHLTPELHLKTPVFLVEVLDELRSALKGRYYMELMD